jgi:hypothetical protein
MPRSVEAIYKEIAAWAQVTESMRAIGWHVHCFTDREKAEGRMMVEFVRDVIVAVAVLAMLVAIAAHPGADAEPKRHGTARATAIASNATPALAPPSSPSLSPPPSE